MCRVLMLMVLISSAWAQRTIPSLGPCDLYCRETIDKGHIIHLNMNGDLEVFNREGLRLFEAVVLSPAGGKVLDSRGAAIDTDETVAVTAVWEAAGVKTGGVVLFDGKGRRIRTIETGRFRPEHVTFDPTHYIWIYGWQADAEDRGIEDRQDYTLVRKFSREGAEEGRVLWRRSFPGWTGGVRVFRAVQDRIGMMVVPAMPP